MFGPRREGIGSRLGEGKADLNARDHYVDLDACGADGAFDAAHPFGLTFDHPRTWREVHYDESGSFATAIVFLGNAKMHDPCTRIFASAGVVQSEECGSAITALRPGDVFASWFTAGMPHGPGPEIADPNAKISGRPADVTTARPGDCGRFNGQETVTARIAIDHDNEFQMTACLRGPNLAGEEALVRRMLSSVHVTA